MLIRPATLGDLPALERLAAMTGAGFTSLNPDRERLTARLEHSAHSFEHAPDDPQGAHYLFAMEDTATGEVAGVCGIKAAVGLGSPFYSYRVGLEVNAYPRLDIYQRLRTLYLCNDYTGCAEIGSLFLAPEYRGRANGRLLSKSRFLFLAEFAALFPERVIAEMRGVSDEAARSPVWESLGKHFLSMEFTQADYLSGSGDHTFIAELMPRHPIYVSLLSAEAQACIGQVHHNTVAARRILEKEGFRYQNYVDIFDAGPTLEVHLGDIRTVRISHRAEVAAGEPPPQGELYLVANTRRDTFRCTRARLQPGGDGRVALPATVRDGLQVDEGDPVRIAEL